MAKFIVQEVCNRELASPSWRRLMHLRVVCQVESVAEYDEYCHYVAGLVGIGLSDLFVAAELEGPATEQLSNSMGLFLQVCHLSAMSSKQSWDQTVVLSSRERVSENEHHPRLLGGHQRRACPAHVLAQRNMGQECQTSGGKLQRHYSYPE